MMNTLFLRKIALFLLVISFASCDKDFNTIGSDVIGNENFTTKPEQFFVKAYNQKIPAVESQNLTLQQIGVLDNLNDVLGKTNYDFVTALTLASNNPIVKASPVIDSVILTVPYISTRTNSVDPATYDLNGIYTTNINANTYDPIDLKVYRNGYFLRDTDPVTSQIQKHYSNESALFDTNKIGVLLNNKNIYLPGQVNENTAFVPSPKGFVGNEIVNNVSTPTKSAPRMRLHLDNNEFKTTIIDAIVNPATKFNFETTSAFKNYYRGLYFKANQIMANKGTSLILDFAKGDVTIYYKQNDIPTAAIPNPVRESATITMNMTGNTVSLLTNTYDPTFTTGVSSPNTSNHLITNTIGDKKLYLKGGEGAVTFLELFTPTEINNLKAQQLLINEASLTFTVDNTSITSDYKKAQRIYIFNADDNTPILDYYFDTSTNSTDALLNKYIHGGLLELVTGGKDTYKVRITEHVNNIIKKGAKNVRLGVIVTENIAVITSRDLITETPASSTTDVGKTISKIPVASITNRLGTVFYGSDYTAGDANYNDRVKFEIYYTKPN